MKNKRPNTSSKHELPNYNPILWVIFMFAVLIFISGNCQGQTFAEVRGGSITDIDGGGAIGAGLTQHLGKTTLSTMFNAYTLGGDSYDSYDLELGRLIGNESIAISPIIGFGYNNQRSYVNIKDCTELSLGGNILFNIQGHKIMALYRYRDNLHILSMGIKLKLVFSKNKKHRFF